MPSAIERPTTFTTGPRARQFNAKGEKKMVRRALAASLGSSRRRYVDRSRHQEFLFELDETSFDLAFVLRVAGVWDCLPRAQKSRIRRLPPMVLTSAGHIATSDGSPFRHVQVSQEIQ